MPQKELGETSTKHGGKSQLAWMEVHESIKQGKERVAQIYKLRLDTKVCWEF
jgi:hypothetical protein